MVSRRTFLGSLAASLTAGCLSPPRPAGAPGRAPIRAIAFDAFPIFDPRSIVRLAEQIFPGRGGALVEVWRARQFEYQWLRALSGRYADFHATTADALVFATTKLSLSMTTEERDRLLRAHDELAVWPDAPAALAALKGMGISLSFLSNMTRSMLASNVARAGLVHTFDHLLSADGIQTYKPDPRAYRLGIDSLGVAKEEILFVAFAGWDAAGAKWFGYETFWVNRLDAPGEELGVTPDGAGRSLADLVGYVTGRR
jgi:2-haloacid dehalogenase